MSFKGYIPYQDQFGTSGSESGKVETQFDKIKYYLARFESDLRSCCIK